MPVVFLKSRFSLFQFSQLLLEHGILLFDYLLQLPVFLYELVVQDSLLIEILFDLFQLCQCLHFLFFEFGNTLQQLVILVGQLNTSLLQSLCLFKLFRLLAAAFPK